MRRAPLLGLLLLTGGCLHYRTPSGEPGGIGVLVQATTGRCTTVVVGRTPRRVCLPPPGTPEAETDTTTADSARITR